jgi:hypothetical protein
MHRQPTFLCKGLNVSAANPTYLNLIFFVYHAQGDVICTCPDSPISSENDFYPHPPNVTNATEAPAAEGASNQARAERPIILRSMALPRRASLLISPYNVPAFAQEQPPRGLSYKWAAAPPLFAGPAAFAPTARRSPQGLWVGAPPPMNPPNGDYPVRLCSHPTTTAPTHPPTTLGCLFRTISDQLSKPVDTFRGSSLDIGGTREMKNNGARGVCAGRLLGHSA